MMRTATNKPRAQTPLSRVRCVYALYPASFASEDSDTGYGNFAGVTKHLDYIAKLADVIWFNPVYPSPRFDCWYDVQDPYSIDPLFGSDEDLDHLLAEAKKRGLRVIFDLVVNHVSHQHKAFQHALDHEDSRYRNWFIFHPPTENEKEPSNHISATGSAWTRIDRPGKWCDGWWYYHTFAPEQPDLNTANPEVVDEICNWIRHWYRRGVSGFRLDAIPYLGKRPQDLIVDEEENKAWDGRWHYERQLHTLVRFTPGTFDVLDKLSAINREPEFGDHFMILEGYPDAPDRYVLLYQSVDTDTTAPIQLDLVTAEWRAAAIRNIVINFMRLLQPGWWPVWNLGNHDNDRFVNRVSPEQAYVAMMLLLLLPGTAVLYYGDDLGMSNGPEPDRPIDAFKGPSRAKPRAPMSWTAGDNAGFCPPGVKPWVHPALNYLTHNVETEENAEWSLLHLTRALAQLRNSSAFLDLTTVDVEVGNPNVLALRRGPEGDSALLLLNFTGERQAVKLPAGISHVLLQSHNDRTALPGGTSLTLKPHEGLVLA
jgi:alpha-glucosidase